MFTLPQLKAAHAKVKSGADFPAYVQEIMQMGLQYYEFKVANGQTTYHGADGFNISSDPIYPDKTISTDASPATVRQIIADHQQGKSDFMSFCQLVADAGVVKWVVDARSMLCSYYDLVGNTMVAEPIPQRY
ncbi:DUF1398 domain-containing protein [Mucilaginibacter psychrotolerans]|uniref:DUF1398 domain-containing protein n=1 Tax=Mucilaginibacter psychrotolerans TaxID=1524096 RepID=A0A4Y8S7Q4_9SPHI|nr:DUF1398 family protein [Mucilaginibacter psychrotolerans]TFF34487.1 DUF1398 domain-containing protein [Mucilaginibacter psychrotolerans]